VNNLSDLNLNNAQRTLDLLGAADRLGGTIQLSLVLERVTKELTNKIK